jgi:hypothetical protein
MPNGLSEIKKMFDKTFGQPGEALQAVRGISEALSALDAQKLRLLRSVLDAAAKVKGSPGELEIFLEVIRLITSASMEQLTAIRDILTNLSKILKYLPREKLGGLPIKEIISEIAGGMKK